MNPQDLSDSQLLVLFLFFVIPVGIIVWASAIAMILLLRDTLGRKVK